jgi:hypothetical protein
VKQKPQHDGKASENQNPDQNANTPGPLTTRVNRRSRTGGANPKMRRSFYLDDSGLGIGLDVLFFIHPCLP